MCPVIREMQRNSDISNILCVTGQHREMLDSVLDIFDICADYDLNIMKDNQTLLSVTQCVIEGIDKILDKVSPDLVLVHGDTTTAYATALACFYRKIPIGHVEAGLRTYDIKQPFPEEFNRKSIDMMAEILFAPTENARRNLIGEGIPEDKITVTGNTIIDAMGMTVKPDYMDENLLWASDSRLVLLTAHRRENLGEPMKRIFLAVKRIVEEYEDVKCIFPVHLNPLVQETAEKVLGNVDKIRLIRPMDVVSFHNYIAHSFLVLTDSGGIQEEAPAIGKPVLVIRDVTERPEGIQSGSLKLVGTDEKNIYSSIKCLLENKDEYHKMSIAKNPYGDGNASKRIVDTVLNRIK